MNKKIITIIVLLLLVNFLFGCASNGYDQYVDGIPFVYYSSFTASDVKYEVYEVEQVALISNDNMNTMKSIKYDYQEIDKNTSLDTSEWIINYYQDYDYQISKMDLSKEVLNTLYEKVAPSLDNISKKLGITLEYYPDDRIIEREYIVNQSKDFDSVLIVDLSIPYRLVDCSNHQTYIIYIPVKTTLAYRKNADLELILDDKNISLSYEAFISLSYSD